METGIKQTLIFFYIHEIMLYREEVKTIVENLENSVIPEERLSIYFLRDYLFYDQQSRSHSFALSFGKIERKPDSHLSVFNELRSESGRGSRLTPVELAEIMKGVFEEAVDKRKIVITFSHSNGFSINVSKDGPYVSVKPKINKHIYVDGNVISVGGNKKVNSTEAPPELKISRLWISDFAQVLDKALPAGDKIDLMLMVNCNMQLMDTLFSLKKSVSILVASQTQFSFYGFHYRALLSTLKKYGDITPALLAKEVVKQFVEKYTYLVDDGRDKLTCNTLFAQDMDLVDQLIEIVNNVTDYYLQLITDARVAALILKIRVESLADVSNYPDHNLDLQFVDFGALLKILSISLGEKENKVLTAYSSMYQMLVKNMLIAGFIGDDYSILDQYRAKKYYLSGISVFFPSPSIPNVSKRVIDYTAFSKKNGFDFVTKWDNFLEKLYGAGV